jgi:FlaA1/EpsC-like NDP-sugar epimerase
VANPTSLDLQESRPGPARSSRVPWLLRVVSLLLMIALAAVAYVSAFLLRFDFEIPPRFEEILWLTLPTALICKTLGFAVFRVHRGSWRYVSLLDAELTARACGLASLLLLVSNYFFVNVREFPRSIYALDFILSLGLVAGSRISLRLLRERSALPRRSGKRLLLVGAGDSCELLLRQLQRRSDIELRPLAIVDDDASKRGMLIHGVSVVGGIDEVGEIASRYRAEEILIAIPSAAGAEMRRILSLCRATRLPLRVLPRTEEVLAGSVNWRQLRPVQIEDLLRRAPVVLDVSSMSEFLDDRVVMVTGAGGSIGSEICRQLVKWKPRRLIALEQAENPLFALLRELSTLAPDVAVQGVIRDITDEPGIEQVFAEQRPAVIVHAAAHKHVPLMERNVPEAVRNNVFGTRTVAAAAGRHGAEHFLLISTDKAVNPSSVMGTTKRLAELVIQDLSATHPGTRYVAVRFGNVLGSQGSVVPIFQAQIAAGGPVTVTHPAMRRYFMTIPEAAQLALQAAALDSPGDVFVLDMGEPVRIVDLAEDLIRLSGYEPGLDIEIRFTGIRPGEKLFEDLMLAHEADSRTPHEKIFVGNVATLPRERMAQGLAALSAAMLAGDEATLRALLGTLVPEATLRQRGTESGRVAVVPDTVDDERPAG